MAESSKLDLTLEKPKRIGESVTRREDPRLLTGNASFVDDIHLPGMAHVALLPSPYPHARILSIDVSAAETLKGVLLVMTGAQAAEQAGPLPTFASAPILQHCLAVGKVRHVGEPVVAVVAESRYIAEDALSLILVDYEELPAQVDMVAAAEATGDGVLHENVGTNVAAHEHFSWGPVQEAFEGAEHVVTRKFRWPRVGPQPMETNGAVATYDAHEAHFTIWSNFSMPSMVLPQIAGCLKVAPHQITFPTLYAGGSFGGKGTLFNAPVLTAILARACGRPVKYVEDRLEYMTNGNQHGSDRLYEASLAVDSEGRFTGLRINVLDDYGAYFVLSLGSHGNALSQAVGPYRIGALAYEVKAILTNKTQQCAYRGFGGEVGNFILERLVDAAASELGRDRVELRLLNFIQKEQFPYTLPNGNLYDSGDYPAVLARALQLADLTSVDALRNEAKLRGKRIGVGIATVNERSVLSAHELWMLDRKPNFPLSSTPESVQIRVDVAGTVIVTIYAPHWGNSPETVAAQLTAHNLDVPIERVVVRYGDTDSGLPSFGPAGSRYTVMIAGAIAGASRALKEKMHKIAAHVLSVEQSQLRFGNGEVVCDNDLRKRMTFSDIAVYAHAFRLALPAGDDFNSGLVASFTYDHPYATLPTDDRSSLGVFYPIVGHAAHIVVVEVDEALRKTSILKYVAVHDAGTIVNPKLVDGQIRGGIAQGIGTALYEKYRYDEDGQLVTASLADYMIPTATEVPDMIIDHIETPSPFTELGIKGCGEGGRLASMPAIASAIDDAFSDNRLYITELPVTPSALHEALAALT